MLRTVDVTRDFGGVHAVAGVSIEVRRGTLTGLIGPNGAGKSTLLAMLAGTMPVTSGQVIYAGADVTGVPAYRRARLGLVRTFQLASEFKRLTVMENLLSAVPVNRGDSLAGAPRGRRYRRRDEEAAITRARALLDRFGLSGYADTYAGDLSGGQRRLTEIMRALMTEPTMLLLDEPMAGVHPRLARQIGVQLLGLGAEGMTILMVEHELAIMDEFCDPVIVMAEGTVLATGTMAALRARAEEIRAGYGAGDIIHGVSLSVAPRTVASVVGPNGSGKSTLMKALTGVIRLSSSRVFVGDRDITGLAPEEVARAGVGYVPQIDDVFAPLTVRENLEMGGYLLPRREVSARIDHVVSVFPRLGQMLTRNGRLSGGERKMLAMGRVLMLQPAVFLLDEPTANLAPKVAAELLSGHVRALAEAGAAVLVVEQRAKAVLAISDYTYVLGGGQVLMADTPARLSASQEFTESFFGAVPQSPKLS